MKLADAWYWTYRSCATGHLWDARALPAIALKAAILDLGRKTVEGRLVRAVILPWFDIAKMLQKDPRSLYQIHWSKWEEIIILGHQDVSKGVFTTTSEFAPQVREDPTIKPFVPFKLELKSRDDLLAWLAEVSEEGSSGQ